MNRIAFTFRYYWVVVLELEVGTDGKPKPPSKAPGDYNRTEIKTYDEYLIERAKGNIVPYIAGYFTTFPQDGLFIVGNDTTFRVNKRRRRNIGTTSYRNGPLIADTSYVVFQRAFVTDVSLLTYLFIIGLCLLVSSFFYSLTHYLVISGTS